MQSDEAIERITRRFHADQQNPVEVFRASEVPARYEAITPAWLTDLLCRSVPGAQVVSYELGPVDNGSSNRRRIHLAYNEVGHSRGLPRSVFCKAAHTLIHRTFLRVSRATVNEVTFYRHLRAHLNLAAPNAYLADYDAEAWTSIFVFEDMAGNATFCDESTEVDFQRACNQMDVLATLHGSTHERTDLFTAGEGLLPWNELWQRYLDFGHAEYCAKGFAGAVERGLIPQRLARRESEVWPRTTECVLRHAELPRMVTHNDVHLKNWFLMQDGQMGLGDWQCLAIGNWSRDVAYTISTALTVDNRRRWDKELLHYYLERLRENGGPRVPFEEAWNLYRQQLFAALSFWTVTLTPSIQQPENLQPEHTTVEFLRRISTAIDDLDALDSFGA